MPEPGHEDGIRLEGLPVVMASRERRDRFGKYDVEPVDTEDMEHLAVRGRFTIRGKVDPVDVIEHIEEDLQVLIEITKALVKSGGVIITVPQHQFLWSQTDEIACH